MNNKSRKLCSTPINLESESSSISISPIKYNSASSTCDKTVERANVKSKQRKRKRQPTKFKNLVREYKRKICSKSQILSPPHLFLSPERVRDLGIEKEYELSPPLIGPNKPNLPVLENEGGDEEEEILSSDENKIEADDFSWIFDGSKVAKTYGSTKNEKLKWNLLTNNRNKPWLVDVKIPTSSADLLWENYITNLSVEFPHFPINYTEKDDPRYHSNDANNATDEDRLDILDMLDEGKKKRLKSKKICRITGGCSRKNVIKPWKIEDIVYVSDDDELTPSVDAGKGKKRRGNWIIEKTDVYDYDPFTTNNLDSNVRKEDDKQMTFNDYHMRCKRKKCNVQIKSVEKFNAFVYKRPSGNFGIKNY